MTDVLGGLAKAGVIRATSDEIRATGENVLLVTTFWLNFSAVRAMRGESARTTSARAGDAQSMPEQEDLTQGIYQVMLLIAPFLRDAERLHLNTLAQAYKR